MDKVREVLAYENLTDTDRKAYWEEVEARRVRDSELHTKFVEGKIDGLEKGEAIGLEKGEAIGLIKGEAIGLEKGEAIGLEKGEAIGLEKGEARKANSIAQKLLKKGMSIEDVMEMTDLSIDEINHIINDQSI